MLWREPDLREYVKADNKRVIRWHKNRVTIYKIIGSYL